MRSINLLGSDAYVGISTKPFPALLLEQQSVQVVAAPLLPEQGTALVLPFGMIFEQLDHCPHVHTAALPTEAPAGARDLLASLVGLRSLLKCDSLGKETSPSTAGDVRLRRLIEQSSTRGGSSCRGQERGVNWM